MEKFNELLFILGLLFKGLLVHLENSSHDRIKLSQISLKIVNEIFM